MIWRRFKIYSNTTIADLHHIIQFSMGWDDSHLHQFRIYAKDYGIWYDGGPSFMDSAHLVQIEQFEFDEGEKFTYEYNFYEFRLCDIRIEKIEECNSDSRQPKCIGGSRIYHEYPVRHELDVLLDMSRLIEKLYDKVTKSRLAKAKELAEEYESLKFSRKRINQLLLEFHSDPSYRY